MVKMDPPKLVPPKLVPPELIFRQIWTPGTYFTAKYGVTGYFAPQEIWHPHTSFPRKIGTPSGNLTPPTVVVF